MINVTKTYLPDKAKFIRYIDKIYDSARLTNNGPLLQELTVQLEKYLGVENLLLVANGTLALQIAYKALGVKGAAVTTPFSFVATTSSLVWEGIEPQFADINPETCCIDPDNIEAEITSFTSAIVPVHVFGNACDVERIEAIANKYKLKTIYDGAHAFGVKYKGKSVLSYGDASILSFHATKLFHTIEGGAIIFKYRKDLEKANVLINFGIDGPDSVNGLGINAKMNEFEAAMGLCVLDEMELVLEQREKVWKKYDHELSDHFQIQKWNSDNYNYSYFPVVFKEKSCLLRVMERLNKKNIFPRRYFYPSLNNIEITSNTQRMIISEEIAERILCLPLYAELQEEIQNKIIKIVEDN
jgi:dTDP-4-amino-4,6-dideoxygalactose transaminase